MSSQTQSVLEVFQLNKNSKEDDLEQCISWLRDVFHDNLPKTISVVVKRLGGYDPLNTTNLSKSTFKGINSTVNASLMNNTIVGNQSFNGKKGAHDNISKQNDQNQKDSDEHYLQSPEMQKRKGDDDAQNISKSDQEHGNVSEIPQQIPSNKQSPRQQTHNNQSNTSLTSNTSFISKNYDENDPQSVADKAKQYYLSKNFNEALELYQKSQNLAYNDEENNVYIGSIYANAKQRAKAIEELKSAYEMRKKFDVKEIIEMNEQNSKEGNSKFINSNPLYFINLTLGNLYNEEKDYQSSIFYFEEAYKEIKDSTNFIDVKNQSQILNSIGLIYYTYTNEPKLALEKFEKSVQTFEQILKIPEHSNDIYLKISYANRMNNLGEAQRKNNLVQESIEIFLKVLEIKLEGQKETNDYTPLFYKSLANTYNNLGMSYYVLKEYNPSITYFNTAVEFYEEKVGLDDLAVKLSLANVLNQRGECYRHTGRLIQAAQDYGKSYKYKADLYGDEHKSTIISLNNYAQILFQTKQYEKAKIAFTQLLSVQQKTLAADNPLIGQTFNNLGTVLSDMNQLDLAEAKVKEAVEIFEKYPQNQENLERVRKNLIAIQQKKQKLKEKEEENQHEQEQQQ